MVFEWSLSVGFPCSCVHPHYFVAGLDAMFVYILRVELWCLITLTNILIEFRSLAPHISVKL